MRAWWGGAVGTVLLTTIVSCSSGDEPPCRSTGPTPLRGHYLVGHELHALQLCGSRELIAVNVRGTEPGWALVEQALGPEPVCGSRDGGAHDCRVKAAYVEVTGVVCGGGGKGHLGKFEKGIDVANVMAASSSGPGACTRPEPAYPR